MRARAGTVLELDIALASLKSFKAELKEVDGTRTPTYLAELPCGNSCRIFEANVLPGKEAWFCAKIENNELLIEPATSAPADRPQAVVRIHSTKRELETDEAASSNTKTAVPKIEPAETAGRTLPDILAARGEEKANKEER